MSNILACKLYTVQDHSGWPVKRDHEHTHSDYAQMHEVMTASALKHIKGLDRIETHRGSVSNVHAAFQQHLVECYMLWRQGHNVLSADLDVVFMRDHAWFTGERFTMFARSDPPRTAEFAHYLNCGIKYFPKSLPLTFWDELFKQFKTWDYTVYDHEQQVLNRLFWSQGSQEHMLHLVDHRTAYQWVGSQEQNLMLNRCDWREARAIHVHGSRGPASRVELMRKVAAL